MKVVLIKYNAGNTRSVINGLNRLGIEPVLSDDREIIQSADKVIFPGVGEASSTMLHLKKLDLDRFIPTLTQPVLGICLGMQLMCRHSEENSTTCMGIFDVDVRKFTSRGPEPVPHMGWNTLFETKTPLLDSSLEGEHMYFVHSYYVPENKYTVAKTRYINNFTSAIQKDNFFAVQFHPEKSADAGAKILQNFLEL